MLKRKVYRELLQWKERRRTEHIKKCLLLKGARQVGKLLKIPQIVPQLLHHPVTEQINSLSSAAPGASSLPLAC